MKTHEDHKPSQATEQAQLYRYKLSEDGRTQNFHRNPTGKQHKILSGFVSENEAKEYLRLQVRKKWLYPYIFLYTSVYITKGRTTAFSLL